jgi:predicted outer membrane lipoprotein
VRRNTVSIDRIVTVDFIFVVNFAGAAARLTATDAAEDAVRQIEGNVDLIAAFGAARAVWIELIETTRALRVAAEAGAGHRETPISRVNHDAARNACR